MLTQATKIELRFPAAGTPVDRETMVPSAACPIKGPLVLGTSFPALFVGDECGSNKAVVWRQRIQIVNA